MAGSGHRMRVDGPGPRQERHTPTAASHAHGRATRPYPHPGVAAARSLPSLDVSPYGSATATRANKLSAAVRYMTAVRDRLINPGAGGQPAPFTNNGNVANCLR